MIKKWVGKIFPRNGKSGEMPYLDAAAYGLSEKLLDFPAKKVVKTLQAEGFSAYIVGGAVRDLLLGRTPKDFDVATDARPEEVRKIFRRSRIIGRRFQIVHVMSGTEIIEVSTFRGADGASLNDCGRIMRDNVFGTLAEDAARRDFTCNALYYDPAANVIVDYHGGVRHLQQKRLVMIGEPAARFQEDPMRILRAVRLSAKLGLQVDADIQAALPDCAHLIKNEPAARLFDEIMKELLCGHSWACLQQFRALGLDPGIHPVFAVSADTAARDFIQAALAQTDARVHGSKPVSAGFILAALLWGGIARRWQENRAAGLPEVFALQTAIADANTQTAGWGVPHRHVAVMREIWQLQAQFENRRGKRPFRLIAQPRFRAAYDFLLLRAQAGEVPQEIADWWTAFQAASPEERNALAAGQSGGNTQKRRRRRKPQPKAAGKNTQEMS